MKEGVKIRKVNFFNNKKQKLYGILNEVNKENIFIICHGFGSNKNRNFIYMLDNYLFKNDFSVLIFDFTGNGESDGEFSDGNYTQETNDLGKAIDFVKKLGYEKIGVIGHSMGGTIAILRTAIDSRINYLISISAVGYSKRFRKRYVNTKEKINQLKEKGYIILEKNQKKLTKEFIEDVESYDIMNYIKKIKVPFLIINGGKDDTINVNEAKNIYKNANEPKKLEIIPNADHNFGYKLDYDPKSPKEETREYKIMRNKILEFLGENLK